MFKPTEAMYEEAAKRETIIRGDDRKITADKLKLDHERDFVLCTDAPDGSFPVYGLIYEPLDDVRAFEEEHHALVYHVINYFFGLVYVYLYVTDNPDEWESERNHLKNGEYVLAYIKGTKLHPVSHAPEGEPDEGIYARSGIGNIFLPVQLGINTPYPFIRHL